MSSPVAPMLPPPPPVSPLPPPPSSGASASVLTQGAVYGVCVVALGIATVAAGAPEIGVACAVALGIGVLLANTTEVGRLFDTMPAVVGAIITGFAMGVLLLVVASAGVIVPMPALVVLLPPLTVAGLDWTRLDRIGLLPFVAGVVVLFAVAYDEVWVYPAALVWIALAMGSLWLVEQDRRAALPKVQPLNPGDAAPPRPADLVTTVLIALAVAVLAALVLSVPSCQIDREGGGGSSGTQGYERTGGGEGGGQGGGGGSGQTYVPDPDGRFLIPSEDGGGGSGGLIDGIPSPEGVPPLSGDEPVTRTFDDGTTVTWEELPDGGVGVEVTGPDGETRSFELHEQPDGLTRIDEIGPDGEVEDTWWYDPDGRLAEEGEPGSQVQPQDPDAQEPDAQDDPDKQEFPWWILLVAVVIGILVFVVMWMLRRPDKPAEPPAPPWAIALARRLGREGAARGCPRASTDTVHGHGAVFASTLGDERVGAVADVVSEALFSRRDPGPEVQAWAESTFEAVLAEHPEKESKAAKGAPRDAAEVGSP